MILVLIRFLIACAVTCLIFLVVTLVGFLVIIQVVLFGVFVLFIHAVDGCLDVCVVTIRGQFKLAPPGDWHCIKDNVLDVFIVVADILFWSSQEHWKDSFIVMLEWCDKFLNLKCFWFLDINEKSFVVSVDLCVFIKLAVNVSLDESIEGID